MARFSPSLLAGILSLFLLFPALESVAAPDGRALFTANCATCHNPLKDATGPALKNVDKAWPRPDWGYDWIHNPSGMIASGDPHAVELFNKYKPTVMTAFPNLKKDEIDAIIKYVDTYEPPNQNPGGPSGAAAPEEDNSWLYTLITAIMLILAIILWRVNAGLKRVAQEKEGVAVEKEIPIYRHKFWIAAGLILVTIMAGYWIVNGAIGLGRQTNYQPTQPIFYSHKVHAGINQINCLYCHAGAEKSKHAMIPSSNVCMNCHKQISEYTGDKEHPLKTAEGEARNGTQEIQRLYSYAGWDPVKKDYKRDPKGNIIAKPIQWTKIHNLPDHVYFNHSQHVKVGQIQCQRCHGNIEEMDEVYQSAPLSMGWCINCHRQTQVKFSENNYYSIFEKYHKEIKDGKRDGVTVEDIGGIECQKCHY